MKIKIRLYYPDSLIQNQVIVFVKGQAHYLLHVMRIKKGQKIYVFNATHGEWEAEIIDAHKKEVQAQVITQTRPPQTTPDIWLCFAPVKNAPLNYLTQKTTELGITNLQPVITEHTIVSKINKERLEANAIEAAEQSRRLSIPTIHSPVTFKKLLEDWPEERPLILCDESGKGKPISTQLSKLNSGPLAILIGPEGGFSESELAILHQKPYVVAVGLGPRILRADTAAIAALSCVMSTLGDWDTPPTFNENNV